MNRILSFVFSLFFLFLGFSMLHAQEMDYYLPEGQNYDSSIPLPEKIIGHKVGEYHISHDKLLMYMSAVAGKSNRVTMDTLGYTYEKRPIVNLIITHPDNHAKLEGIRQEHLKLSNPNEASTANTADMPSVVWQGFSIHGNEPSGSNAALLTAYHWAAAQGEQMDELLREVVIIFDPCFNPDGLNRFASWANTHKPYTVNGDPNTRELNEAWPGGRTNHYWFDMNRDWLPLRHPESRARIAQFQRWKPNILTDHHEMGTNSTFFFQPGIPSRTNPITPQKNQDLTEKISRFHAAALDKIGSLYYSKEDFDDFYYGKGSTYPDAQGSIGILFEQGSSRGHNQESEHGLLSFPFTIRNQFITALSTVQAGFEMRRELLDFQREFYQEALREAQNGGVRALVFGDEHDPFRAWQLAEILHRHRIEVYQLGKDLRSGGQSFKKNQAWLVPMDQPQARLIRGIFERRTNFTDSLFYDISAWSFDQAFDLPKVELSGRSLEAGLKGPVFNNEPLKGEFFGEKEAYAYVIPWKHYLAPKALYRLLDHKVKVKGATKPFQSAEGWEFSYGDLMIAVQNQEISKDALWELLEEMMEEEGLTVYGVKSGLAQSGSSLGSRNFVTLRKPEMAILVDGGVSSYEAGEVWHLLDFRYEMPVTLLPVDAVSRVDLSRYDVIMMVNGYYGSLGSQVNKLKDWVRNGGTLITSKSATKWVADQGISPFSFKKTNDDSLSMGDYQYKDLRNKIGAQYIGGAIFNASLDPSHPLGFGYTRDRIALFRNSSLFMEVGKNGFAHPLRYTNSPLSNGYISPQNIDKLKETAGVGVASHGKGKIISFTDNPNFRAFWYGTNRLYLNAIFFGEHISATSTR